MRLYNRLLLSVLFLLSIGCTKTTYDSTSASTPLYTEYYTIQVGQSMLYRLDSTVLLSFGSDTVTHTYLQKDSVMSVTTDLTGNLLYTVNSYIKPYTGDIQWTYLTSYRVTPKVQTLELVDANNLRFVKMASPVTENFSWDGNNYFMQGYTASTDDALSIYQDWNYQYTNVDSTITLTTGTFPNGVTVKEVDTEVGGPFDPAYYYSRTFSEESYAKGWGLIHRKQLFLIWQNSTSTTGYEDDSYGIELTRVQQ
ncbi:MAG: hypothetical protein QM610_04495 [Chitinophagaceae bacterium]